MADKQSSSTKRLQALRKAAGFTSASKFADSIGMSVNTYTHYEQSEDSTPLKAARTIAQALGCTIDAIAGIEKPPAPLPETPVQDMYDGLSGSHKAMVLEMMKGLAAKEAADKEAQKKTILRHRSQELQRYRQELTSIRPELADWDREAFNNALARYIKDDLQRQMDEKMEKFQDITQIQHKLVFNQPLEDEDQYIIESLNAEGMTLGDITAMAIKIDEEYQRLAKERDGKFTALILQLEMEDPVFRGKAFMEKLKDTALNVALKDIGIE